MLLVAHGRVEANAGCRSCWWCSAGGAWKNLVKPHVQEAVWCGTASVRADCFWHIRATWLIRGDGHGLYFSRATRTHPQALVPLYGPMDGSLRTATPHAPQPHTCPPHHCPVGAAPPFLLLPHPTSPPGYPMDGPLRQALFNRFDPLRAGSLGLQVRQRQDGETEGP